MGFFSHQTLVLFLALMVSAPALGFNCALGFRILGLEPIGNNVLDQLRVQSGKKDKQPIPARFVRRLRVGDGKYLLKDAEGRSYLVEEFLPVHATAVYDLKGKRQVQADMAPGTRGQVGRFSFPYPKRPLRLGSKDLDLSGSLDYLVATFRNGDIPDGVSLETLFTPQLRSALRRGIEYQSLIPIEKGGGRIFIGETQRNGQPVIVIHSLEPLHTLVISDEAGRTHQISEADFRVLTQASFPADIDQSRQGRRLLVQKAEDIDAAVTRDRRKEQTISDWRTAVKVLLYGEILLLRLALTPIKSMVVWSGRYRHMDRPMWLLRDGLGMNLHIVAASFGAEMLKSHVEGQQEDIPIQNYLDSVETEVGPPPDQGVVLFLDGIPTGDLLEGAPAALFDRHFKSNPRAVYKRVQSMKEFSEAILSYSHSEGTGISTLVPFMHGNVLKLLDSDIPPFSVIQIGNDVVISSKEAADELDRRIQADLDALSPEERDGLSAQNFVAVDLMPDMTTAFTPGARVPFVACSLGRGKCGDDMLSEIKKRTLGSGGGVISMAELPLAVHGLTEMPVAKMPTMLWRSLPEALLRISKNSIQLPWILSRAAQAYVRGKPPRKSHIKILRAEADEDGSFSIEPLVPKP